MSVLELLSQPPWQRLGLALVHFLWQGFAVGLLVAVVVKAARLRHGNARYLAYLLALAVMIACPAMTFSVIDVGGPVPVEPAGETATVVDNSVAGVVPVEGVFADVEVADTAAVELSSGHSVDLGERMSAWVHASLPWVPVVWMGGVAALSFRLLAGFVGVGRWRRQLTPLPDAMEARVDALAARLGLRGAWRVFVSRRVVEAMAVGWVRPMVLLPAAMVSQMPPEMLEAVIAHELAHIRRLDLWVNLAQRIVETLLFYHPAVWWVSRCLRAEREFCCDEMAVRATGERAAYATTLERVGRARSQARRPVLAAGLGRDRRPTLARVRHVLGLSPAPGNGSFWLAGLVVLVLLAGLVFSTARALENDDSRLVDLERAVVQGIRANRARFECGYLAWKRVETRYDDAERNLSGEYELWWDGKKVATKYVHEVMHMTTGGQFVGIDKQQGGYSYDGGVLSRKPRYGSENWLAVSRWSGDGSLDWVILRSRDLKNVAREWTVVDVNDVELVRLTVRNTNKEDSDYGAWSIEDYDPGRGFGLVNQRWYNPDGSRRLAKTVRMAEVAPGGWFPVEIDTRSYTAVDRHLRVRQRYVLDLTRCKFNDRSALPKGIFTWTKEKQEEEHAAFQEKLQRRLAMELGGLSRVKEAAADDAIKQDAYEVAEAFVTAGLAGDLEVAAGYAGRLPRGQIGELAEIARGQDLQIMAVLADDASAIAVSSVIQGDHERIGPLVFTLNRTDADSGGKWLVDDIDMETPDSAEAELVRFLERHPEAQKITPKKSAAQL
ncbi:MAG: M56 family metallopeptidase [Phycisphaerae bacterium]|nr:M56 family metallopeptidase [Phycisphaerae bacterium]